MEQASANQRHYLSGLTPLPFILAPWLEFRDAGAMPWFLTGPSAAIFLNTALTRRAGVVAGST